MQKKRTPDGYMEDAKGNLVPIENVREIDLMRDRLVRDIIAKAENFSANPVSEISWVAISMETISPT